MSADREVELTQYAPHKIILQPLVMQCTAIWTIQANAHPDPTMNPPSSTSS